MRKIKTIAVIILLLLGRSTFAQSFSLEKLRQLNKMSMDAFRIEMEEKQKFVLANKRIPPEEPYTYHAYELKKEGGTLTMEKILYSDRPNTITYNTIYKKDLETVQQQLLKEGYKVKSTSKVFGNTVYITDYTLNGMEVQLVVPMAGNGMRYGITVR